jgi:MarR family transcriptional regulator, organic hydroperoxide resistance regulator
MVEFGHLFPQLFREHIERSRSQFESLGLARGQPGVLNVLWQRDGLTQTEIGDALHVQPATVTKMVQRMEEGGWVARREDPSDLRVLRVYLTEAGRQVRPQVECILEAVSGDTLAGFSLEEQLLLRRFMLQMRDNLRRVNGG